MNAFNLVRVGIELSTTSTIDDLYIEYLFDSDVLLILWKFIQSFANQVRHSVGACPFFGESSLVLHTRIVSSLASTMLVLKCDRCVGHDHN